MATIEVSASPKRRFGCNFGSCTRSFSRNTALEAHIDGKHHGEKTFRCIECGTCFTRGGDLNKHTKNIHLKLRRFRCESEGCNKAYATRFELNRHIDKAAHGERSRCKETAQADHQEPRAEDQIQAYKGYLQSLQLSFQESIDECLILQYKNSLLERILLEKGMRLLPVLWLLLTL